MEKRSDSQTGTESKNGLVEQIRSCLHSGDYSRALDLLRAAAEKFPSHAELSELDKLARDGTTGRFPAIMRAPLSCSCVAADAVTWPAPKRPAPTADIAPPTRASLMCPTVEKPEARSGAKPP